MRRFWRTLHPGCPKLNYFRGHTGRRSQTRKSADEVVRLSARSSHARKRLFWGELTCFWPENSPNPRFWHKTFGGIRWGPPVHLNHVCQRSSPHRLKVPNLREKRPPLSFIGGPRPTIAYGLVLTEENLRHLTRALLELRGRSLPPDLSLYETQEELDAITMR